MFRTTPSLFSRETLLEFSSHYFCPYRRMTVAIVGRIGEEDIIFRREEREVSWGSTALKIISYATVIFPLFVFFVATLGSLSFSPKEGGKALYELMQRSIVIVLFGELVLPQTPAARALLQARALKLIEKLDSSQLSYQAPESLDTPLHFATTSFSVEFTQALTAKIHPSKLSLQNRNGETPLYLAVGLGKDDRVALFLIERLDPSQLSLQNNEGYTPLFRALFYGREVPYKALVSKMPLNSLLLNSRIVLQKKEDLDTGFCRPLQERQIQILAKKIQQAIFTIGLVQASDQNAAPSTLRTFTHHTYFDRHVVPLIGQFL